MPKFFFHLRECDERLLDPEGVNLSTGEMLGFALKTVRELIAADAIDGLIDLTCSLEVEDESGRLVHTQPFATSVQITC